MSDIKDSSDKKKPKEKIIKNPHSQIIYADRILELAFSTGTVKLRLGTEVGNNEFINSSTLVFPTLPFLQSITMLSRFTKDPEILDAIIKELDKQRKFLIENESSEK